MKRKTKELLFTVIVVLLFIYFITQDKKEFGGQPIIIDTDFGTDLDDAYAIMGIIADDEADVKMIVINTETTSNSLQRANILAKLLDTAGITDIPVYYGRNNIGEEYPYGDVGGFHYGAGTQGNPNYKDYPNSIVDHTDFKIKAKEIINQYDGETIILVTGPNAGAAELIDSLTDNEISKIKYLAFGGRMPIEEGQPNLGKTPMSTGILIDAANTRGLRLRSLNWQNIADNNWALYFTNPFCGSSLDTDGFAPEFNNLHYYYNVSNNPVGMLLDEFWSSYSRTWGKMWVNDVSDCQRPPEGDGLKAVMRQWDWFIYYATSTTEGVNLCQNNAPFNSKPYYARIERQPDNSFTVTSATASTANIEHWCPQYGTSTGGRHIGRVRLTENIMKYETSGCSSNPECDHLDGIECQGNNLVVYEGVCSGGNCVRNADSTTDCTASGLICRDAQCQPECTSNDDCSDRNQDYCIGSVPYHDVGECVSGSCQTTTTNDPDCAPDPCSNGQCVSAPGLVFWMDASTGSYNDQTGNVGNPTPHGDVYLATSEEIDAYYFDNNGDYIVYPAESVFEFGSSDSFSMSAAVKLDSSMSDQGYILNYRRNMTQRPLYQLLSGVTSYANYYRGNTGTTTTDTGVSRSHNGLDQWNHIVSVRNTATDMVYLYINGVLRGSTNDKTTGTLSDNNPLVLGNSLDHPNHMYHGYIHEIKLWNKALDSTEVQAEYDAFLAKIPTCASDADCTHLDDDYCDGLIPTHIQGKCNVGVGCYESITTEPNCPNACDNDTATCVDCGVDDDCLDGQPFCSGNDLLYYRGRCNSGTCGLYGSTSIWEQCGSEYCDPDTDTCVECLQESHCGSDSVDRCEGADIVWTDVRCVAKSCESIIMTRQNCPDHCDPISVSCVECTRDSHCGSNSADRCDGNKIVYDKVTCDSKVCRTTTIEERDCSPGYCDTNNVRCIDYECYNDGQCPAGSDYCDGTEVRHYLGECVSNNCQLSDNFVTVKDCADTSQICDKGKCEYDTTPAEKKDSGIIWVILGVIALIFFGIPT